MTGLTLVFTVWSFVHCEAIPLLYGFMHFCVQKTCAWLIQWILEILFRLAIKYLFLSIFTCDTHMVHGIQLFICVVATTQTYYIISTLQQVGVFSITSEGGYSDSLSGGGYSDTHLQTGVASNNHLRSYSNNHTL